MDVLLASIPECGSKTLAYLIVLSYVPSLHCTHTRSQELPKKKRASPTDLSGLTDQEKVARRKRHAREYSRQARLRNSHLMTKLADEVDDLSVVRSVFEEAPNVYMVLAGDIRSTTILYANQATEDVLHHAPGTLLGRCVRVGDGDWEIVRVPENGMHR